jgi:hypothetical protein
LIGIQLPEKYKENFAKLRYKLPDFLCLKHRSFLIGTTYTGTAVQDYTLPLTYDPLKTVMTTD